MDEETRVTYKGDNFAKGWIGKIKQIEGEFCMVLWEKPKRLRCRERVANLKEM